MTKPPYLSIHELVDMMDEAHRTSVRRFLEDHWELVSTAAGSSHNHQAWPGGYLDHIVDAMNTAVVVFPVMNGLRPLPFTLSDVLVSIFWHDAEKPFKYRLDADGQPTDDPALATKAARAELRWRLLDEYEVPLTDEMRNALTYIEGENDDYTNARRVMGPLAAFCHMFDEWSGRGWHDFPRRNNPRAW